MRRSSSEGGGDTVDPSQRVSTEEVGGVRDEGGPSVAGEDPRGLVTGVKRGVGVVVGSTGGGEEGDEVGVAVLEEREEVVDVPTETKEEVNLVEKGGGVGR